MNMSILYGCNILILYCYYDKRLYVLWDCTILEKMWITIFFLFCSSSIIGWEMIFTRVKKKIGLQDERASFNTSCCTMFIGAVSLARWYVIAAVIGFLKLRRNIPPFPKAASEVGVNMWRNMKRKVGHWSADNKFIFKIRALHCTPLEFRPGFLAGGF